MDTSVSAIFKSVLVGAFLFAAAIALAQTDPAQMAKGQKVYTDKKCALCHKIAGKGGKIGGDLSNVGAKRNAKWLRSFMKNPKAVNPKVKMAPFKGSDDELKALVAYMASLK